MNVLGFNAALEKQPDEQLTIKANFVDVSQGLVISGYVFNACDVIVFDQSGTNQTGNMVQGSPTLDGNNYWVFPCFKGGNDGENYYARFRTTWIKAGQPDQKIERDLLIKVRQKGW
jgi:hypothetical protein